MKTVNPSLHAKFCLHFQGNGPPEAHMLRKTGLEYGAIFIMRKFDSVFKQRVKCQCPGMDKRHRRVGRGSEWRRKWVMDAPGGEREGALEHSAGDWLQTGEDGLVPREWEGDREVKLMLKMGPFSSWRQEVL